MMQVKAYSFPSATGCGDIAAKLYIPEEPAHALLQIVHGMAEHVDRYDAFCRFLAKRNLAVCLHDQAGHGKSATSEEDLGFFGGKDSLDALLDDVEQTRKEALSRLDATRAYPVVLLGHSMGSFIARLYCSRRKPRLAGAIFSATRGPDPQARFALALARRSVRKNGPRFRDESLAKLIARGQLKRIPNAKTPYDWLSRDEKVVEAYRQDPLCGFTFTAAGYADLFRMTVAVSSRAWFRNMPAKLPVLLLSGTADPIGQYGRGPRRVCQRLKRKKRPVSLFLYHQGRHEMLNETNREVVWQDLLAWLNLLPDIEIPEKTKRGKRR